MTDATSRSGRFRRLKDAAGVPGEWLTLEVELPSERIQFVCALFEGFDNAAMIRTPDPGRGLIHVYVPETKGPLARQILAELARRFPLRIASESRGMVGVDALWAESPEGRYGYRGSSQN